jgi:hypothetical protein
LRLWGWLGVEAHRPRARVARRLGEEWAGWTDLVLEVVTATGDQARAIVEFRVAGCDPASGRYLEHNRALVVKVEDGAARELDLYCALPVPNGPRKNPILPATASDADLHRFFHLARQEYDLRRGVDNNRSSTLAPSGSWGLSDHAHPASNFSGGTYLSDEEADAGIEAVIERYRSLGYGFQWWVSPYDRPADLPQRLERHGLARAGGYEKMLRRDLQNLDDIPVSPRVTVEPVDGSDDAVFDAAMHVMAVAFHEPPEHAADFAAHWRERMRNPEWQSENRVFLARVDGQPAGTGRIVLRDGMGYLVAGSTLPEFRGQYVYATLLRRRLEAARERGFELVALDAGPMSRAVVERYRFEPFGTTHVYVWMPVMDPAVIRDIVPQE